MAVFDDIKHRHAICLKFQERFFTSLSMLGFKPKPVSALQSKKIYLYIVVSFWHLLSLP